MFRTSMTLDVKQRGLTAFVGALVAIAVLVDVKSQNPIVAAVLGVVLTALALAWAMSPSALVVDAAELRIERRVWRPLRVPRSSILGASALDGLGPGTLRLFGVGGFFGSYGLFKNTVLGQFRLYATRGGTMVVLQREPGLLPIVLTPDDTEGTMRALERDR